MTLASSSSRKPKPGTKKPLNKNRLPLSVTNRDGKTTVRQLEGRRFVRISEVRGKVVAYVELFTSQGDSHSITVSFADKTVLHLGIAPGFTVNAEYYKRQGLEDPKVLKSWPEIRSEV